MRNRRFKYLDIRFRREILLIRQYLIWSGLDYRTVDAILRRFLKDLFDHEITHIQDSQSRFRRFPWDSVYGQIRKDEP